MIDEDDEVRDRASFYHYILSNNKAGLKKTYLLNDDSHFSLTGLEHALTDYMQDSSALSKGPFSLAIVPLVVPTLATTDNVERDRTLHKEQCEFNAFLNIEIVFLFIKHFLNFPIYFGL